MSNINQRLNGLNPLSYIGVDAVQPTDFITKDRDPTVNDSKNFYLGTWWLNTATLGLWYLAALSGNIATWIMIGAAGGAVVTLTGNAGGAVPPTLGNINVVGDAVTINVVGNPGTSTLTISTAGPIATSYNTQAGVAIPAAGVLNIIGTNGIVTSGAGNTVTVTNTGAVAESFITNPATGIAVPAAGVLTFAGNPNMVFTAGGSTISLALGNMTVPGGTVVYDGTDLVSIATGTAGQVLTSNGAGVNPSYQTTPGSAVSTFTAFKTAGTANQTGNSGVAYIVFNSAVTNVGGNYATGTGIYTAPSLGVYQFNTNVSLGTGAEITALMTDGYSRFQIAGTGPAVGDWVIFRNNPAVTAAGGGNGNWTCGGSITVTLNAGDTVRVFSVILNGAGDTVSVLGNNAIGLTWFSGSKLA